MIQADKPLVWLHGEIKTMKAKKINQLEARGWKVGSVEEFLGLTEEETTYIELKLLLSESLAERRKRDKLKQVDLAKLLKSSQSRVAKMEKGDPTVSLDLLIRSLLALGTTKRELAKIISYRPHPSKV